MKWILRLTYRGIVLTGILFLCMISSHAQTIRMDTCGINDACEKSILIPDVISDSPFVCIEGCNLNASPAPINTICGIADFPTVWFKVQTDGAAALMNINVKSDDFDAPTIDLFYSIDDCTDYYLVPVTQSNLNCIVGTNGEAEAIGTEVGANETYYIAVSSLNSHGGQFEICVNTISEADPCVQNAEIEIIARSGSGPLDGPFFPGETVSVCFNVNSYTAAGNGCQWFQGLIPFFGNGWDPSSFDQNGQPIGATINGTPMGYAGNGLYGASTWDWFSGIGYHFDYPFFQIGDMDGNGSVEMCNQLYDVDCLNFGGVSGGCCGPCWVNSGDPLPPGWFAYGINGTCATPGPPPTLDWGDGNTCGGGMGPWHFCFDLNVRDYPGCLYDQTTSDLTLGFFTTADGETGSWTGGPSVCALDQPHKLTLPMLCRTVTHLETVELPDACAGSKLNYEIFEPGIEFWTWENSTVTDSVSQGVNGYILESLLNNPFQHPIGVNYIFTGYVQGSQDIVIKEVTFTILPSIIISLPDIISVCDDTHDTLVIQAASITGGNNSYSYLWSSGDTTRTIIISPPFHNTKYQLLVTDSIGCTGQAEVEIKLKPCLIDTTIVLDESNDDPKKEDLPIGGVDVVDNALEKRSSSDTDDESIRIYPIPSKERVVVEWNPALIHPSKLFLYDTKGTLIQILNIDPDGVNQLQIDISNLNPGVFLVAIQSDRKINMARLIKL